MIRLASVPLLLAGVACQVAGGAVRAVSPRPAAGAVADLCDRAGGELVELGTVLYFWPEPPPESPLRGPP